MFSHTGCAEFHRLRFLSLWLACLLLSGPDADRAISHPQPMLTRLALPFQAVFSHQNVSVCSWCESILHTSASTGSWTLLIRHKAVCLMRLGYRSYSWYWNWSSQSSQWQFLVRILRVKWTRSTSFFKEHLWYCKVLNGKDRRFLLPRLSLCMIVGLYGKRSHEARDLEQISLPTTRNCNSGMSQIYRFLHRANGFTFHRHNH